MSAQSCGLFRARNNFHELKKIHFFTTNSYWETLDFCLKTIQCRISSRRILKKYPEIRSAKNKNHFSSTMFMAHINLIELMSIETWVLSLPKKLRFNERINSITSKASALGFVKRFCYDLNDMRGLKSLCSVLVQSIMEYCSVV